MKELLDDLHIKHITSLPYKPSSNGQVEQFNRTIKNMIMQYMAASNLCRYLMVKFFWTDPVSDIFILLDRPCLEYFVL